MRVTNKDRVVHVVSCLFNCDHIVSDDNSSIDREQYTIRCVWYDNFPSKSKVIGDRIAFKKFFLLQERLEAKEIELLSVGYQIDRSTHSRMVPVICFEVWFVVLY